MSAIFDQFPAASFGGFKFPFRTYSIKGGVRDHVHEYPHSPGGAPEKLGRKLYELSFDALFFEPAVLSPEQRARYEDDLFGDQVSQLNALRGLFEAQQTAELVVPHLGKIQAYAINWDEKADTKNRSGVEATITFREDQDAEFAFQIVAGPSVTSLQEKISNVNLQRAQIYQQPDFTDSVRQQLRAQFRTEPSIWATFDSIANSILAIQGSAQLYGSLYQSKLVGLTRLCQRLDTEVAEFNNPDFCQFLEALHQLWFTAQQLAQDVEQRQRAFRFYTTVLPMAIGDVSAAIYGSTEFAVDLMRLNALEDPLAIPAGTRIAYYPPPRA